MKDVPSIKDLLMPFMDGRDEMYERMTEVTHEKDLLMPLVDDRDEMYETMKYQTYTRIWLCPWWIAEMICMIG